MMVGSFAVYKYSIALHVVKITVERLAPDMLILLVASQPHCERRFQMVFKQCKSDV